MKQLIVFLLLGSSFLYSQGTVDIPAKPLGGIDNFQFIYQSQLLYPEILLKKNINANVTLYFDVLKDGKISNIEVKDDYPTELIEEAKRLTKYILFQPASIGNIKVDSKIFLVFNFNTNNYKKFCKQRGFITPKEINLFDTSFVIYDRADVSPQYYKGDDALNEYVLSNLEYPDIAIRQNIQGTVLLSFIVEPNGTLSNIVVEKEFNHLCTNEAIRVLKNTKWKPGIKDGKFIRYKTKYPIIFNLNNINKDNATSEQR
jgi:TonB family protein